VISQPEQMLVFLKLPSRRDLAAGVAVIVLPATCFARCGRATAASAFHAPKPTVCPSDDEIAELATLLNNSKKTTILQERAAPELTMSYRTRGQAKSPHCACLRARSLSNTTTPSVSYDGLLGFSSLSRDDEFDTLLMLGTDFPYRQFYPQDATVVQIDIRGEQIGRRTKVDLGLIAM